MSVKTEVLDIAAKQLQDATNTTWIAATLLSYYNLALLEICNLKPEAYPVTKTITLVAGASQSLDDDAIELLDVVCNMGTGGSTPGKNIRMLAKEAVDLLLPDWQTYPAGTVILFVMIDSRNPKYYYTIPPVPTSNPKPRIKLIQAEMPDPVTDSAEDIALDSSYTPACIDCIIYRALAESTTIPGAMQKAGVFKASFLQSLGIKTAIEKTIERKEKGEPDAAPDS